MDRDLATQSWMDLFRNHMVSHLNKSTSDHVPILISWDGKHEHSWKKQFRYKDNWNNVEGCQDAVAQGWAIEVSGLSLFQVSEKIKAMRMLLLKWAKQNLHHGSQEIKEIEDKLTSLLGLPFTEESRETIGQKKHSCPSLTCSWNKRNCFGVNVQGLIG